MARHVRVGIQAFHVVVRRAQVGIQAFHVVVRRVQAEIPAFHVAVPHVFAGYYFRSLLVVVDTIAADWILQSLYLPSNSLLSNDSYHCMRQ